MNTVENLQRAAQMIWDAATVLEAAAAEVDSALISAIDLLTLPEVIDQSSPEPTPAAGWVPVVKVDPEGGTLIVQ
jgi:hypothetical protein